MLQESLVGFIFIVAVDIIVVIISVFNFSNQGLKPVIFLEGGGVALSFKCKRQFITTSTFAFLIKINKRMAMRLFKNWLAYIM